MKNKLKKIILVSSIMICLIVCCGLVSATKDIDTNILSANTNNNEDMIESSTTAELNIETSESATNTENSLDPNNINEKIKPNYKSSIPVSGNTFNDIQEAIDSARNGDTIELNGTYIGNGTSIKIDKTLTIKGDRFTVLDSKDLSKILEITEYSSLKINNVTFKSPLNHICIDNNGKLNISDSIFKSDYRYFYDYCSGETIYSDNELILNKCVFSSNRVYNDVISNGYSLIDNCTFTNGYHIFEGGGSGEIGGIGYCLKLSGNGSILNSKFFRNTGVVMSLWNNITVKNCEFSDNTNYGESLIILYNSSMHNCSLINNYMGDNYFYYSYSPITLSNGLITNCTIINSTTKEYGGAICVEWGDNLINDCKFINCSSEEVGGAISTYRGYPLSLNITILNCSFINNNANEYGGAIYNSNNSNMYVINSSFSSNVAEIKGDDIYNMGNLTLSNNQHNDYFATIYNTNFNNGSMIYSPLTLFIVFDNFTSNSCGNGSEILIYGMLKDENGNLIGDDAITLNIGNKNETMLFNDKYRFFDYALNYTDEPLNISGSYNGTNNLTVKIAYLGLYNSSNEKIVPLEANGSISFATNNGSVSIILKDNEGHPISNGKLNVTVNNVESTLTTDSNGKVSIPIDGNSTVVASYKDANNLTVTAYMNLIVIKNETIKEVNNTVIEYVNNTVEVPVIPNRTSTKIIYKDMNTKAVAKVDGRVGEYFNVNLTDANGKPLANKLVQIGFNGAVYNRTTNDTGGIKLQINLGYEGKYTFAIAFLGDDNYTGSFEVALITVNKHNPNLSTPTKTYKANAKTKTLTATFQTANGNAISGKKISFTINGKTYIGTTNAQGVASVKISLNKKGTYSSTAKYAGDGMYKATSTKFNVKIT